MPYLPDLGIIIIIFLIYYFSVLIFNKRLITNPNEIITKLFMSVLLYLGVAFIYFAFTGRTVFENGNSIQIYIFVIGFVTLVTAATNMLKDFNLFRKVIFTRRRSDRRK